MVGMTCGACYVVTAGYRPTHRPILISNIVLRLLATAVFWHEARYTSYYEAVWGVVNAVGLALSR